MTRRSEQAENLRSPPRYLGGYVQMDENLIVESERLVRSWMQHESDWLRDYLVQQVEDPRINLQSIFSRHFILRALFPDKFLELMQEEYRFSACMNWLRKILGSSITEPAELQALLQALKTQANNADGLELPQFLGHVFQSLPLQVSGSCIPDYIECCLTRTNVCDGKPVLDEGTLNTFQFIWATALLTAPLAELSTVLPLPAKKGSGDGKNVLELSAAPQSLPTHSAVERLKVFEPACGSANDYRYLHEYGLARWIDYTGLDLCPKNICNARKLFPGVKFELGNVFEIQAKSRAFDLSFVHDLFEHLSPEGLEVAIGEICRVTRLGICANFFNVDEIPEHRIQPTEEYYWNRLSLARLKESFAGQGFSCQVVHAGTFLAQRIGCFETHNPNAYTLFLWRVSD